jgi:hypothetical protein
VALELFLVFWLWCFGFGVLALVFWLWCFGFGVLALVFWLWCFGFEVSPLWFHRFGFTAPKVNRASRGQSCLPRSIVPPKVNSGSPKVNGGFVSPKVNRASRGQQRFCLSQGQQRLSHP